MSHNGHGRPSEAMMRRDEGTLMHVVRTWAVAIKMVVAPSQLCVPAAVMRFEPLLHPHTQQHVDCSFIQRQKGSL